MNRQIISSATVACVLAAALLSFYSRQTVDGAYILFKHAKIAYLTMEIWRLELRDRWLAWRLDMSLAEYRAFREDCEDIFHSNFGEVLKDFPAVLSPKEAERKQRLIERHNEWTRRRVLDGGARTSRIAELNDIQLSPNALEEFDKKNPPKTMSKRNEEKMEEHYRQWAQEQREKRKR